MYIDILLFFGIFIAHFVAVLSGGVGLIVRPLLIFAGVPPQVAIGSGKIANLVNKGVSLKALTAYRKIDWRRSAALAAPAFIGGWLGAEIVSVIEDDLLKNLIGITVILMGLFLYAKPHLGLEDLRMSMSGMRKAFGYVFYMLANMIATLTGGGGALTSATLVVFFGETYISSAMIRKVAGYASTISGSIVFLMNGLVSWYYVLILVVAGSLGGWFGVKAGIKGGDKLVRYLILGIVIIVGIALLVT